ncbi:MAG: hypothetical protein GY722_12455 [bacterium]|nr:hypothetical protein [bacterium]
MASEVGAPVAPAVIVSVANKADVTSEPVISTVVATIHVGLPVRVRGVAIPHAVVTLAVAVTAGTHASSAHAIGVRLTVLVQVAADVVRSAQAAAVHVGLVAVPFGVEALIAFAVATHIAA